MSIGVKLIDDQHKTFIQIMNDLYDAYYGKKDQKTLEDIINQLLAYKSYHFATEEKYFDLFHYEKTDEHKQAHKTMKADVEKFSNRLQNKEDIIIDLLEFVENWLVNHIETQDKEYSKCFLENGLK